MPPFLRAAQILSPRMQEKPRFQWYNVLTNLSARSFTMLKKLSLKELLIITGGTMIVNGSETTTITNQMMGGGMGGMQGGGFRGR